MQIVTVSIVVMMCALMLFRFNTVSNRVNESAYFYSTSDVNGYNAAVWLKENFPDVTGNVTVTEKPGSWFGVYSGKSVIAETNPVVEWNIAAESILDLSYEIEHPLTLVRGYVAKGYTSDENYVSLSGVWRRVSSLSEQGVFLSFTENGAERPRFDLSSLSREIVFDVESYPKRLVITYFNDDVSLTENLVVHNDSYPIDVVWSVSALRSEIENVTLYITYDFDLSFSFEQAYIPEVLDWENPWDRPSFTQGNDWAVVNFSPEDVTGKYVGIFDEKNEVAFAMQFVDLPPWGNVGVLGSRQINAIRFEYQFDKVKVNQPASLRYRVLTFSRTSFPEMQQLSELENVFDSKVASGFAVSSRSYADYIRAYGIKFLVYDKSRFDSKLLNCDLLQLVYSNYGYVICRVKSNP